MSAVELVIQAPAKLNLFFEVLAKRTDGYHEIESLMCPIDLYDTLHFQEDPSGQLELTCRRVFGAGGPGGRGLHEMPEGPENLVFRAVELVRRRTGIRRGAKLWLVKRIPAAAGLGGGSSDAAAALVAANEGWRLGRSRHELAQWAAELGSDVPFFLAGGPAICRGRGERVEPVARAWHGALCGGSAAGRPFDGRRVWCLPAGGKGPTRPPAGRGVEARRLATSGPPTVESVAVGRRKLVALDQAIGARVLATGLFGTRNEWKRHVVLWTLPSRPRRPPLRATFGRTGLRRGVCRAKLPLIRPEEKGEQFPSVPDTFRTVPAGTERSMVGSSSLFRLARGEQPWKSPKFVSSSWTSRESDSKHSARSRSTMPSWSAT